MKKGRKQRRRVKVTTNMKLVHKNDATRVAPKPNSEYPVVTGRLPADNGATFRVKIRKKKQ